MELKDIFYVTEKDWYKLQAWATIAYDEDKNEISGLMTAVPQEDGRIKIGDVEILKQENSASNTELNADSVAQYTMKYAMKYNNPNMKFVWWHSHHTMSAFWSGTDENEIDAWKNTSYSLALVINLKEEYKFRVSFWRMNGLPVEQHVDTNLTIERKEPNINITPAMSKQYKELCEDKVSLVNTWNNHVTSKNGHLNYHNQTNIWQRETDLNLEDRYDSMLEEITSLQESFLDGTCDMKNYNEFVKELNAECKKKKFPFKIKDFKLSKVKLHEKLMTIFPSELFEWENNIIKEKYESNIFHNYGGWNGI